MKRETLYSERNRVRRIENIRYTYNKFVSKYSKKLSRIEMFQKEKKTKTTKKQTIKTGSPPPPTPVLRSVPQ